jgi:hypothetical protein
MYGMDDLELWRMYANTQSMRVTKLSDIPLGVFWLISI